MEAEDETLVLFDLNWFHRLILFRSLSPPPLPLADEWLKITANSFTLEPPPTIPLSRHYRSRSDELAPSPETRSQTPRLQTILSGNVTLEDPDSIRPSASAVGESREQRLRGNRNRRGAKRRKNGGSKSLSDLEFQELKGFMDLGFTFSDAQASDPWLISIVPGLQRLKVDDGSESPAVDSSSESEATDEIVVVRPYLSEAWETEEEEMGMVLWNWRIPAEGEGVDMKDYLRFWAHTVASAVL